jgi:hypothetical protein
MLVSRCPVHRELRCHVNVLTFSSRRVLAFMFRGPTMSVGSILKAPSVMGSANYRTVCTFLKKRYATSSVSLNVLLRTNFSFHVVSKFRLGAVQEFNRFLCTACACCASRRYLYTISGHATEPFHTWRALSVATSSRFEACPFPAVFLYLFSKAICLFLLRHLRERTSGVPRLVSAVV